MKREWLKELGLDVDQIDKVMKQNGEDIESVKSASKEKDAEIKGLKENLADRDKQLEDLKKSTGDSEALKEQIAEMQKSNKEAIAAKDAEILSIRKNNAVEKALNGAQAKNIKAVIALLNLDDAELSEDGTIKGLDDQIKKLKESEDTAFLFNAETKPTQPTLKGATPANGGTQPTTGNEWESKLAEARKNGDTLSAIAIKREAMENGVNLL